MREILDIWFLVILLGYYLLFGRNRDLGNEIFELGKVYVDFAWEINTLFIKIGYEIMRVKYMKGLYMYFWVFEVLIYS